MRKCGSFGPYGVRVPMLWHLVRMRREFTFNKGDSLATATGAKSVVLGHTEGNTAT